MSLRTIQRVGIASSLLLGAFWASGCDDDDGGTGTPADAGVGPDGGGDGDGDMPDAGDGDGDMVDAGNPDAGPGIPKMCEGQTTPCATVPTGLLDLEGCCDTRVGNDGVGVCGGIVAIPGQKTALDGCHGLHQVGMQSDFCGAFFDAIEGESGDPAKPFDHANGKFDVLVAGSIVNFAGCCNETSICGVNVDSFDFGGQPVSPMLGCVPVDHFQAMMGDEEPPAGDAGAGEVVAPFCVVNTDKGATCPPKLTVALPGQDPINLCDQLTAIGAIGCDPTAATPEWVCAANGLTSTKTGDVPVLAPPAAMEYIVEIVHGCGDTPGATCVPNVPANVYGAVDLDTLPDEAKGAILAKVPDFVCGCGEGGADSPLCMHNVAVETCGTLDVENAPAEVKDPILAQLPDFLCGCGDAEPNALCLKSTANTVCGTLNLDALTAEQRAPFLVSVPEFLCGCGDAEPNPLCLRNNANTICGGLAVDSQDSPALVTVPEYLCGCGNDATTQANQLPCLAHVVETICGAVDVPANIPGGHVPLYPSGVCGCGEPPEGTKVNTASACLDNVVESVCGSVAACTVEPNSCPEGQVCVDVKPATPDGLGDACITPPP